MLEAIVNEYYSKFAYIIANSKRIDYDWYNKDRRIIWIDDEQYLKDDLMYYSAYLATDVNGEVYLYMDVNSTPRSGAAITKSEISRFTYLDKPSFRWLVAFVSLNNFWWKVNKIYEELRG